MRSLGDSSTEAGTSGGQWQRFALARVFFRDAPIVVLDEPTASLDLEGEELIFRALRQHLGSRAGIVISLRDSTQRRAVLHDGELVEFGTHDELLGAKGRYAELFEPRARTIGD